jgi:hypothetical protein
MDRVHHQRRLDAHHRAVAGIDALDLACDQPVGDVAGTQPAIFLRNGDAEQPGPAHLAEDLRVGLFLKISGFDPGCEPVRRKGGGGIADHALVLGQLILDQERVVPGESGCRPCRLGCDVHRDIHSNASREAIGWQKPRIETIRQEAANLAQAKPSIPRRRWPLIGRVLMITP